MRLLERSEQLAQISAAIRALPTGSAFAIAGESGAGKTTLVARACAVASGVRTLRVKCDPLDTPRPLGPLKDLGIGLEPAVLSTVCEEAFTFLRAEPTLLVVEDLHWVDAGSADVLRFLCRRIESVPVVLLLTHRDLDPQAPARGLLAEDVRRIELPPLSLAAVAELVEGTGLDAARVHAATGGNPYFATEVSREPDRPIPPSVRDAVLARTIKVSTDDFEVLQLIAASPDRVADPALPTLHIDHAALARLKDTDLLEWTADGVYFRHELARRAIESTIPPGGVALLHAKLLDALEQLGSVDPSVLTHHAVAAEDSERAVRHARAAARDAVRAGAHTEAVAFYEIARDHQSGAPARERAELLLALANEQYMVSRLAEAIASVHASFPLWSELDDQPGLATAHIAAGIYEYYSAERERAEAHLSRASEIARQTGATTILGHAQSHRAYLAYMRGDGAGTESLLAESEVADDEETRLWSRIVADSSALAHGEAASRERLFTHVESARAQGYDELVSTVYSQVVSLDVEQGRLLAADRVLADSLPFTVERDIQICLHWQTAVRSRLHLTRVIGAARSRMRTR